MSSGPGSGSGAESGKRPEDEPGSGVMTAFGRQLKLLRLRAGLDRVEFGLTPSESLDAVKGLLGEG
ncbi:hypothetical protein ACWD4K_17125 [Streptomyces gelaticus]